MNAESQDLYDVPCDPITLKPYHRPTRVLPCGHTLNEENLVELINNNIRTCPVCRHIFPAMDNDVQNFPRNFVLEQEIEYCHILEVQLRNKFAKEINEVKIQEKKEKILLLPPLSESVFVCMTEVADLYHEVAKYENAIEMYNEILKLSTNKNNLINGILIKMGRTYISSGKYDQAITCLHQVQGRIEEGGNNLNEVGEMYYNLGTVFFHTGKYEKALEHLNRAIAIYDKDDIDNNNCQGLLNSKLRKLALASIYYIMGGVYLQQEDIEQGLEFHTKGLNLRIQQYVEHENVEKDHPDLAKSYNGVGECYMFQKKYDKALEYHNLALNIYKNRYGFLHPDVAETFLLFGIVYLHIDGEIKEKAIPYFMKSLKIHKKTQGEKHADIATIYNYIGQAYLKLGSLDYAMNYFELAHDVLILNFGKEHSKVGTSKNNLGCLYYNQQQYTKSYEYLNEAYEIMCKELGQEHVSAKNVLKVLQVVKKKL